MFEDSHMLPPEVEDIFRRVQDSAHYMPDWQMEVRRAHFQSFCMTCILTVNQGSHESVAGAVMDRSLHIV